VLTSNGYIFRLGIDEFNRTQRTLAMAKVKPVVNQVKVDPSLQQEKLLTFKGILLQAYSGGELLKDKTLKKIGEKYKKSVAQVAPRFNVQPGISLISLSPRRTWRASSGWTTIIDI
jgi:diketogulonate reductase-like aldo/keto reductase